MLSTLSEAAADRTVRSFVRNRARTGPGSVRNRGDQWVPHRAVRPAVVERGGTPSPRTERKSRRRWCAVVSSLVSGSTACSTSRSSRHLAARSRTVQCASPRDMDAPHESMLPTQEAHEIAQTNSGAGTAQQGKGQPTVKIGFEPGRAGSGPPGPGRVRRVHRPGRVRAWFGP